MKNKKEKKTTTNSRVYNLIYKKSLAKIQGLCNFCPPHSGCNYWNSGSHETRSWKYYRKTQWKNKGGCLSD